MPNKLLTCLTCGNDYYFVNFLTGFTQCEVCLQMGDETYESEDLEFIDEEEQQVPLVNSSKKRVGAASVGPSVSKASEICCKCFAGKKPVTANIRKSKTAANPDRDFYCCGSGRSKEYGGCDFFLWVDQAVSGSGNNGKTEQVVKKATPPVKVEQETESEKKARIIEEYEAEKKRAKAAKAKESRKRRKLEKQGKSTKEVTEDEVD